MNPLILGLLSGAVSEIAKAVNKDQANNFNLETGIDDRGIRLSVSYAKTPYTRNQPPFTYNVTPTEFEQHTAVRPNSTGEVLGSLLGELVSQAIKR